MQLGGATDLVNVGPPPATDLVNAAWGASDLVNAGPPPATDLVNVAWGGGRLSQCCRGWEDGGGAGGRLCQQCLSGLGEQVGAPPLPSTPPCYQNGKQ